MSTIVQTITNETVKTRPQKNQRQMKPEKCPLGKTQRRRLWVNLRKYCDDLFTVGFTQSHRFDPPQHAVDMFAELGLRHPRNPRALRKFYDNFIPRCGHLVENGVSDKKRKWKPKPGSPGCNGSPPPSISSMGSMSSLNSMGSMNSSPSLGYPTTPTNSPGRTPRSVHSQTQTVRGEMSTSNKSPRSQLSPLPPMPPMPQLSQAQMSQVQMNQSAQAIQVMQAMQQQVRAQQAQIQAMSQQAQMQNNMRNNMHHQQTQMNHQMSPKAMPTQAQQIDQMSRWLASNCFEVATPSALHGVPINRSPMRRDGLNILSTNYSTKHPDPAQALQRNEPMIVFGTQTDATKLGRQQMPAQAADPAFCRDMVNKRMMFVPVPQCMVGSTLAETPQLSQAGINAVSVNMRVQQPSVMAKRRFVVGDTLVCLFDNTFINKHDKLTAVFDEIQRVKKQLNL